MSEIAQSLDHSHTRITEQKRLLNNRFTLNQRELRYRGGPKIYSIVFIEERMVGVTGIEPVTPSMSTKCSPAELYAHPDGDLKSVALR